MSRLRSFASFAYWAPVFLALFSGALTSHASAQLSPNGGFVYNPVLAPSFSFFTPSYISGPLPANFSTLVVSTQFPYNYNGQKDGSFYGYVTSSIWQDPATQKLAFTYVFNNLKPPPLPENGFNPNPPLTDIVRATLNDSRNPWTAVNIVSAGSNGSGNSTPVPGFFGSWGNGDPFSMERKALDQSVAFNFNPLNSGTQLNSNSAITDVSALMWLATDDTLFTTTNVALSDNGHVGATRAYVPTVFFGPEPSSVILAIFAGVGGAITVWLRRRKRNVSA